MPDSGIFRLGARGLPLLSLKPIRLSIQYFPKKKVTGLKCTQSHRNIRPEKHEKCNKYKQARRKSQASSKSFLQALGRIASPRRTTWTKPLESLCSKTTMGTLITTEL